MNITKAQFQLFVDAKPSRIYKYIFVRPFLPFQFLLFICSPRIPWVSRHCCPQEFLAATAWPRRAGASRGWPRLSLLWCRGPACHYVFCIPAFVGGSLGLCFLLMVTNHAPGILWVVFTVASSLAPDKLFSVKEERVFFSWIVFSVAGFFLMEWPWNRSSFSNQKLLRRHVTRLLLLISISPSISQTRQPAGCLMLGRGRGRGGFRC